MAQERLGGAGLASEMWLKTLKGMPREVTIAQHARIACADGIVQLVQV
jgi:hypothetical protein